MLIATRSCEIDEQQFVVAKSIARNRHERLLQTIQFVLKANYQNCSRFVDIDHYKISFLNFFDEFLKSRNEFIRLFIKRAQNFHFFTQMNYEHDYNEIQLDFLDFSKFLNDIEFIE